VDPKGEVTGCAWYLEHTDRVRLQDLRVNRCPLAQSIGWRTVLKRAIAAETTRAREAGLGYVEVGGWAVSRFGQIAAEGLLLALAGYSLGRLHGGVLGLTTATVRHCSSTILRRIGGRSLESLGVTLPSYFDPHYRCEMEILQFDSRVPDSRYERLIERLTERLANVPVLTSLDPSISQDLYAWWHLGPDRAPVVAAAAAS
jgi:hypothetical protein